MLTDRVITVGGFAVMGVCLLLIAYQNVVLGRLLAEVATLIVKTH